MKIFKNFVFSFRNDWKQIGGKYNWYNFTLCSIWFENETYTGGVEFEFVVLGLGFWIRYNYNSAKIKELLKEAKEDKKYIKLLKK